MHTAQRTTNVAGHRKHLGSQLLSLLFVVGVTFTLEASEAQRQPVEWRTHFTVNDSRGNVLYVLTQLRRVDQTGGAATILILDVESGQRFVMKRRYDIAGHRSVKEISDVTGKKFFRRWYLIPSAAKTRDELLSELDANPRLFEVADPTMNFETPGFSHSAREADLSSKDPRGRWVSDLRESLDPSFLEGLERMRATLFGLEAVESFYSSLGQYLFHGNCAPSTEGIAVVAEFPDCAFDKDFGFACSDRQIELIAKARGEKRALDQY